jgi:ribosomal protein S18 acetylase RimI-like enzyme
MARYLISFPSGAMDHIPAEEFPAVGEAAHAVVQEAMDEGVWVFGGGLAENVDPVMVAGDGTITAGTLPADQGVQRRVHGPRRDLSGGSLGVGREDRGRLPLCSRDPRVHARPSGGQLSEAPHRPFMPKAPDRRSRGPVLVTSPALEPFTTDASAGVIALLGSHGWSYDQIVGQVEALEALAASENGLALIASTADAVAAFISLRVHGWNRLAQIHGLAVRQDMLRRGLATRLIDAAEMFALDRDCRGIYVDTPVDNEAGRSFYAARGYSEDYRMSRYYADELDGITYVKFFGGEDPL